MQKEYYNCIKELRDDYLDKLRLSKEKNVTVVVVSSEIEAWMLSASKNSNKKSKEDLKKELKVTSSKNLEKVLLQKFIKSKKAINSENNQSLCYFLKKLSLVPKETKCR